MSAEQTRQEYEELGRRGLKLIAPTFPSLAELQLAAKGVALSLRLAVAS
jgi:hypothetical protein